MKMTTWSMSVTLAQALDPGVDAIPASPPHPERSDPANPAAPVAAPIFISSRRVILVGCMGVSVPSSYLDADSTTGNRLGRGLIGLPQGGPGARVGSLGREQGPSGPWLKPPSLQACVQGPEGPCSLRHSEARVAWTVEIESIWAAEWRTVLTHLQV